MRLLKAYLFFLVVSLFVILNGCVHVQEAVYMEPAVLPAEDHKHFVSGVDGDVRPWTHLDFYDDPDHFQFLIVTDRTGGARAGVFPEALRKANLLRPSFVMSVGDLIQGYTEDEAQVEKEWDQMLKMLGGLDMPFFLLPGNHDITNPMMARVWKKRFGSSYYHFLYRDVLFLCLNTEDGEPSRLSQEQIDYFQGVLANHSNVRWTVVLMHKPLWEHEDHEGWSGFEPLLQGRPHTVFAGHFHRYMKRIRQNQSYITLATTGGGSRLRGEDYGEFDHVAWVTMTDDGPVLANLMVDGVWDEDVRTARTAELMERLQKVRVDPFVTEEATFSEGAVMLRVVNQEDVPMHVEASVPFHEQLNIEPQSLAVDVAPNSIETFSFNVKSSVPVEVTSLDLIPMSLKTSFTPPDHRRVSSSQDMLIGVESAYTSAWRDEPVVIDGLLEEWGVLPIEMIKPVEVQYNPKAWHGLNDAGLRFTVNHDETYLYVAARVTDDLVVRANESSEFFDQDVFVLRIDGRPHAVRSVSQDEDDGGIIAMALSPGVDAEAIVNWADRPGWRATPLPEGIRYGCSVGDEGYAIEVAVPMTYFQDLQNSTPDGFRVNISLFDVDEKEEGKTPAYVWWEPDWRKRTNPSNTGMFRFERR